MVDKEKLKEEIAPHGAWSVQFTNMFHRLIDSLGETVPIKELSAIIAPMKFRPSTFSSINSILKVRMSRFELVLVEAFPGQDWTELGVKLIEKNG